MAAAAALFTACNSSPTSPQAGTSAEARADLQAMAAKVKYFAPQQPGGGMGNAAGKAAAKHGAGKVGASKTLVEGCDQDATEYETWNTDTTGAGGVTIQYDTTVSYTSANQLICSFEDVTAYQLTSTRSQNSMLETHIHTRTDLPADLVAGEFKMSGNGTVSYSDGYLITITSMNIVVDIGQGIMKTYVMNLALEKGYTVVLQVAPGADLMIDSAPGPNDVEVSGPISKDGAVVGYFEVMGDDRVIIRDAEKVVIESHG
jgi:hypothetical protein